MKTRLSSLGFIRVGVASPELKVADVAFNRDVIRQAAEEGSALGCRLLLFPELCLTGYTCGDLFFQPLLLEGARRALKEVAEFTAGKKIALVVGAPVVQGGRLFNCGVFLSGGRVRGVVPKTYLPNTQEFYEERWFSSARDRTADRLDWEGESLPFGADLLFRAEGMEDCLVGIEVCEDLWAVNPPSSAMAVHGATLLLNLSASPELLGKEEYRRDLVRSQSARCLAAYAYASAGPGESSTDLVYSGHSLIAEYGTVLAETERFHFSTQVTAADIDIQRLVNERLRNNSFAASGGDSPYRVVPFSLGEETVTGLLRPVPATPFVPSAAKERAHRCREIFALQTTGLAKRLRHTRVAKVVLGISGGLDSTLALLVVVKAFDHLGLDRHGILAVTMPGFGTTRRTRSNAESLADQLGVSLRVISIDAAVRLHFQDLEHNESVHDITFENAQARERTQILMDLANKVGGLQIGTGDLSELALGWCTYNADHMSMYGVNAGVPKTLVRYQIGRAHV